MASKGTPGVQALNERGRTEGKEALGHGIATQMGIYEFGILWRNHEKRPERPGWCLKPAQWQKI